MSALTLVVLCEWQRQASQSRPAMPRKLSHASHEKHASTQMRSEQPLAICTSDTLSTEGHNSHERRCHETGAQWPTNVVTPTVSSMIPNCLTCTKHSSDNHSLAVGVHLHARIMLTHGLSLADLETNHHCHSILHSLQGKASTFRHLQCREYTPGCCQCWPPHWQWRQTVEL